MARWLAVARGGSRWLAVARGSRWLARSLVEIAQVEIAPINRQPPQIKPEARSYYTLAAATLRFKFPEPAPLDGVTSREKSLLKMVKVQSHTNWWPFTVQLAVLLNRSGACRRAFEKPLLKMVKVQAPSALLFVRPAVLCLLGRCRGSVPGFGAHVPPASSCNRRSASQTQAAPTTPWRPPLLAVLSPGAPS
jgi:hypothetical protein